MDETLRSRDMEKLQASIQCVKNPEGQGVRVYMDKTFYNCPLPQIPLQCVDNPEGYSGLIYYDKSFYCRPQSQVSEIDGLGPASGTVPFSE